MTERFELTKERDGFHGKKVLILSVRYLARHGLKEWEFEVEYDGITRKVRGFIETFRLFKYAGNPISESPKTRHFAPALTGVVEIDDTRNELRIKELHISGKVYHEKDAPVRGQAPKTQATIETASSTPLEPITSVADIDIKVLLSATLSEKQILLHKLANEIFAELDASKMQNPTWGKSLIAAQIVQLSKALLPKEPQS